MNDCGNGLVSSDALVILAKDALEALRGVVRVADRSTVEFDAARDVIDRLDAALTGS